MLISKAEEVLQKVFGYTSFRRGQKQVIESIMQGQDVLCVLPTGGGKSLGYQIPALVLDGVTLVVSPLISLMKDQVDVLINLGIDATFINSSLTAKETRSRIHGIVRGEYRLVYLAPERLETDEFQSLLQSIQISLIAIDEAHCISQWGHDFRPSYQRIQPMIDLLPNRPPVAAFTATATSRVEEDIRNQLQLQSPVIVKTGYERENLNFSIQRGVHKMDFLLSYLRTNSEQSGVIYASTRKEVDQIYESLISKGIAASKYHAGLSERDRAHFQEQFLFDRSPVMVATNAFGMGIDKSNVRFVIHHNLPRNMESYYQEAGRAGRDGERSDCILLFSPQDIVIQRFLIDQSTADEDYKASEMRQLRVMINYSRTNDCLQKYIVRYFGDESYERCGHCMHCTDELKQEEMTEEAQKILSCIRRMGERFGVLLTAKVLKGSKDRRAIPFQHLTTYGIMQEKREQDITELINVLIADGYIHMADSKYPILTLTDAAVDVLLGKEKVFRRVLKIEKRKDQSHVHEDLFEQLRELRKELAEAAKMPPFTIFHDVSLREMCTWLPKNKSEMLAIRGMGQVKYEKYGETFLKIIQQYVDQQQQLAD